VIEKHLLTGIGWRIGWSPESNCFEGLVGGDFWAIELSAKELKDFCTLCFQLEKTIADLATELSDQESCQCSSQIENLSLEINGFPDHFSLYFCGVCERSQRRFEGSWAAESTLDFLAAMKQIFDLAFES
jgi:Domain of unknown function (DUF1818)